MFRRPIIVLSIIFLFSSCQEKRATADLSQARFGQTLLHRSKDILENIFSPYDTCTNQFASTKPPSLELCVVQNHLGNYPVGCYKYQLRSVTHTPTEIFEGEVVIGMFALYSQHDTINASVFYYMPLNEQDFMDRKESAIPAKVLLYQDTEDVPFYEAVKCL